MKFPPVFVAVLCAGLVSPTVAQEPVVVKERDVVFPGLFGLGRKVDSETLILPDASRVMRRQKVWNRRESVPTIASPRREQQSEAEASRQAEAAAMTSVAAAPVDAAAAESAMVEASSQTSGAAVAGDGNAGSAEVAAPAAAEPAPSPDAVPEATPAAEKPQETPQAEATPETAPQPTPAQE